MLTLNKTGINSEFSGSKTKTLSALLPRSFMENETFAPSVKRPKYASGFIISDVLRHFTSDTIRPSHMPVHSTTRNQSFIKFHRLQQLFPPYWQNMKYKDFGYIRSTTTLVHDELSLVICTALCPLFWLSELQFSLSHRHRLLLPGIKIILGGKRIKVDNALARQQNMHEQTCSGHSPEFLGLVQEHSSETLGKGHHKTDLSSGTMKMICNREVLSHSPTSAKCFLRTIKKKFAKPSSNQNASS